MAFQVVQTQDRHAQCIAERLGHGGTNQQGTGKPRSLGVRDPVDVPDRTTGFVKDLPHQGQHAPDVVPGRQFGHDPAVVGVEGGLGVQGVCEQAFSGMKQGDTGLIAGGLNAQNQGRPAIFGGQHSASKIPSS